MNAQPLLRITSPSYSSGNNQFSISRSSDAWQPMATISPIYTDAYRQTDFRSSPHDYRIGIGEQGVLLVQPYKSELLPLWRFRTPEIAADSAAKLLAKFYAYRADGDFVGMDMARKYLQMGWTRSRRYANHKGGKKYEGAVPMDKKGVSGAHGRAQRPLEPDPVKAQSAAIFRVALDEALANPEYQQRLAQHRAAFG